MRASGGERGNGWRRGWCTLLALQVALLLALGMAAAPSASAAISGAIQIVQPVPTNNVAEGPVGAHISFSAQLPAGTTFDLGYASSDLGCRDGFVTLGTTIAGSASLQTRTITWPSSAAATGASYFLCARASTTPNDVVQSSQRYKVDAASAPAITSIQAISATPGTQYTTGAQIKISGQNFVPGGTRLQIVLTALQTPTPADIAASTHLTASDAKLRSADDGSFTTTVTLPGNEVGPRYLHVLSMDGQPELPPVMDAAAPITISVAPTPTPQATFTPVTPTVVPSATTPTGPSGNGGGRTALVFGLGGLSLLLFVLGLILLISGLAAGPQGSRPHA